FHLCGEEVRRGDDANFRYADAGSLRILECRVIPAGTEAENRRVRWHQVENQVSTQPAANRCALSVRLVEADLAQAILKRYELGVGADCSDCVHVECGPNRRG